MRQEGTALVFVDNRYTHVIQAALEQTEEAWQFIDEENQKDKELALWAIDHHPTLWRDLSSYFADDEEVLLRVVEADKRLGSYLDEFCAKPATD